MADQLALLFGNVPRGVLNAVYQRCGGDLDRAAMILMERDHSNDQASPTRPKASVERGKKVGVKRSVSTVSSLDGSQRKATKAEEKASTCTSTSTSTNTVVPVASLTSFFTASSPLASPSRDVFGAEEEEEGERDAADDVRAERGDTAHALYDSVADGIEATAVPSPVSASSDISTHGKTEALCLTCDMSVFEPSSTIYAKGVPYLLVANTLETLSVTSSRNNKMGLLVNLFRQILVSAANHSTAVATVRLCTNSLSNPYEDFTIGVAGKLVSAALLEATGAKQHELSAASRVTGDIGDAALRLKSRQRLLVQPAALTVEGVYTTLRSLGEMIGERSQDKKKSAIVKTLRACRGPEIRWITRTLVSNIRTGATIISVLGCVCVASLIHHDFAGAVPDKTVMREAVDAVKLAYSLCPDVVRIVGALAMGGPRMMQSECTFRLMVPVQPMLAKPGSQVEDVVRRVAGTRIYAGQEYIVSAFSAEYKYDGQRAQIHVNLEAPLAQDRIQIFSRNLDCMTQKFGDVCEAVLSAVAVSPMSLSTRNFILDAEIVPVHKDEGKNVFLLLPFQELSRRKRKETAGTEDPEVQVATFVFDLLYLNDASLLTSSLVERRALGMRVLGVSNASASARIQWAEVTNISAREGREAEVLLTDAVDRVSVSLQESIEAGCEGLIVKTLGENSDYVPARGSERSDVWLKLKKDYVEGLGDSFDLVVVGAWRGQGRKVDFWSPYLLACWDPETETLQSLVNKPNPNANPSPNPYRNPNPNPNPNPNH